MTLAMVCLHVMQDALSQRVYCLCCRKRKEKTTPFGVNLMRSQVLYRAAQVFAVYHLRKRQQNLSQPRLPREGEREREITMLQPANKSDHI